MSGTGDGISGPFLKLKVFIAKDHSRVYEDIFLKSLLGKPRFLKLNHTFQKEIHLFRLRGCPVDIIIHFELPKRAIILTEFTYFLFLEPKKELFEDFLDLLYPLAFD